MARDLYVKTRLRTELFNARLSSDSLRLLQAIRSRADADETDGVLHDRVVAGLGVELGYSAARTRRCLSELRDGRHIETHADEHRDIAFLEVCKSAAEREAERSDWRRRTERSRMSRRDAHRESREQSLDTPSPSHAPSPSSTRTAPSQVMKELRAGETESAVTVARPQRRNVKLGDYVRHRFGDKPTGKVARVWDDVALVRWDQGSADQVKLVNLELAEEAAVA